jgi:hypothetical protein
MWASSLIDAGLLSKVCTSIQDEAGALIFTHSEFIRYRRSLRQSYRASTQSFHGSPKKDGSKMELHTRRSGFRVAFQNIVESLFQTSLLLLGYRCMEVGAGSLLSIVHIIGGAHAYIMCTGARCFCFLVFNCAVQRLGWLSYLLEKGRW